MRKLLIANRGEIAIRVVRAARELGIPTVAVCSEPDVEALHARAADEQVVIGPASAARSYLDVDAVLGAAAEVGADAVHPGYGFLSERADFAERLEKAGITFVGPSAEAIRLMGDKALARSTAASAGVPTVPGSDGPVAGVPEALDVAAEIGYPVAVKAAAGGGGRGIRIVGTPEELRSAVPTAQAETAAAVRLAAEVSYRGAGTVEFLYDPDHSDFFFIEMNTRIQVEHPITEMVTGRDLVREQLSVAAGNPLSFSQEDVEVRGHSIELRLNAEDPAMQFLPSPGPLEVMRMPAGPFVRVYSGYEQGTAVSTY